MTARQMAKMVEEYREDLSTRAEAIERVFGHDCPAAIAYRDAVNLAWAVLQGPIASIADDEEAKQA